MTFIQKENSFVTDTVNNYVSFDTKIYYAGGRSPLKLRLRLVLQYYQWKGIVNKKKWLKEFQNLSRKLFKNAIYQLFAAKMPTEVHFQGKDHFKTDVEIILCVITHREIANQLCSLSAATFKSSQALKTEELYFTRLTEEQVHPPGEVQAQLVGWSYCRRRCRSP